MARDRRAPRPPRPSPRSCRGVRLRSTGNTLSAPKPDPADLLSEGAAELGLELDPGRLDRLLALAALLSTWAERLNLTAHRSVSAVVGRLVLDALALERHLPAAEQIADLGSGAGFPGLPLAIVRPDARVLLVESRERRHHFQRTAIRQLGLSQVTAIRGRIEAVEPRESGGVVAQALAPPRQAVEWSLPWCIEGGWIAIPGAGSAPDPGPFDEVDRPRTLSYTVPCGGPDRTVWIGRRHRLT